MVFAKNGGGFTPIGLDVRASGVYAVQFMWRDGAWRLHAAASAPVAQRANATNCSAPHLSAIKDALASQPFKGKKVIASIANKQIEMRRVLLPEGVTADLGAATQAAVTAEARSMLIYKPEEAVIDYIPLESALVDGKRRDSVLMVAAKRVDVSRHLTLLKAAGLTCVHADIGPFAAARVLGTPEGAHAVVDIDNDHCMLSVAQDGKVLFGRTIRHGWLSFVEAISSGLDIGKRDAYVLLNTYGFSDQQPRTKDLLDASETGLLTSNAIPAALFEVCRLAFERFAGEIARSINYFRMNYRGKTMKRLMLVGPVLPKELERVLSEKLRLPVSSASPLLSGKNGKESGPELGTAFVIAAGLAIRGEVQ